MAALGFEIRYILQCITSTTHDLPDLALPGLVSNLFQFLLGVHLLGVKVLLTEVGLSQYFPGSSSGEVKEWGNRGTR